MEGGRLPTRGGAPARPTDRLRVRWRLEGCGAGRLRSEAMAPRRSRCVYPLAGDNAINEEEFYRVMKKRGENPLDDLSSDED